MSERVCQGCGTGLPPKTWRGRDQKWCTDRCRKLTLYSRSCVDCGTMINRDGRVTGAAVRCRSCDSVSKVRWTREAIVHAIQLWAATYGEPPTANEWNATLSAEAGDMRYWHGDWPSQHTLQRVFGSWNAAIGAAGFLPHPSGVARGQAHAA